MKSFKETGFVTSGVHVVVLNGPHTVGACRISGAGRRYRVVNEHSRYWTSDRLASSRASTIPAAFRYDVWTAATATATVKVSTYANTSKNVQRCVNITL